MDLVGGSAAAVPGREGSNFCLDMVRMRQV